MGTSRRQRIARCGTDLFKVLNSPMPPSLPATLPLAVMLALPLAAAGVPLGFPELAGLSGAAWLIALAGERAATLVVNQRSESGRTGLHMLLGIAICALVMAGMCHAGQTSALTGFAGFALATVIVAVSTRRKTHAVTREHVYDALGLTGIVCATLFWARRQIAPLPAPGQDGVLDVWTDYVLHAVEIAQYSNPAGIGAGAMLLAGEPLVFYHRAQYVLPAAVAQWLGLQPLLAATTLLLPLGLCIAMVGTAILADRLAGTRRSAGYLAVACVLALPDAAHYGLRNGFFGMHWLLFTAPGTGWAAGLCLLSGSQAITSLQEGDRRALAVAAALGLGSFFFRAHVFLLWIPALAMVTVAHALQSRPGGRRALVATALGTVAALLLVALVPPLSSAWLAFSAVDEFLPAVHRQMIPTAYDGLYDVLASLLPLPLLLFIAALAILPATLGLMLPVLAGLSAVRRPPGVAFRGDAMVWAMVPVALGLFLFAPAAAHGDFTEYQQRGLPLLYLAFAAAIASGIIRLMRDRPRHSPAASAPILLASAFAAAMYLQSDSDPAEPVNNGAGYFFPLALNGSATAAADFLRHRIADGERLLVAPADTGAMLNDVTSTLVALTGMPAWVGRPGIQIATGSVDRRTVVRERLADIEHMLAAETPDRLAELAGARNIGWIVLLPPARLPWDPDGLSAAYRDAGIAVYRADGVQR
jgi:hypothetical protein